MHVLRYCEEEGHGKERKNQVSLDWLEERRVPEEAGEEKRTGVVKLYKLLYLVQRAFLRACDGPRGRKKGGCEAVGRVRLEGDVGEEEVGGRGEEESGFDLLALFGSPAHFQPSPTAHHKLTVIV